MQQKYAKIRTRFLPTIAISSCSVSHPIHCVSTCISTHGHDLAEFEVFMLDRFVSFRMSVVQVEFFGESSSFDGLLSMSAGSIHVE